LRIVVASYAIRRSGDGPLLAAVDTIMKKLTPASPFTARRQSIRKRFWRTELPFSVVQYRRRAVATAVAKCCQRRSDSRFYRMVNSMPPG
jgi:hypothetical protein